MRTNILRSLLALVLTGAAPQHDVAMIDLTITLPPPPLVEGVQKDHVFRAGLPSDDPRTQKLTWPLRVTLVDVRPAPDAPEKVVAEMRLTATAVVTIPRAEDGHRVDPDGRHLAPGFRQMMVGLRIEDPVTMKTWMSSRAVYGSSAVPESLITLQPGQSVTLRFEVYRDALMEKFLSVPVKGLVRTYEGDMTRPNLMSGNSLPLPGNGK